MAEYVKPPHDYSTLFVTFCETVKASEVCLRSPSATSVFAIYVNVFVINACL
jgi:hypothetical protein